MKVNGYKWKDIPWREIEIEVGKLQRSIYKLAKLDNLQEVWSRQLMLIRMPQAKMIAVRRVTQDNRGKATAGVDGVKSVPADARLELSRQLKIDGHSDKILRVMIPKANGELRPLGIPTIRDRAKQMLVLMALEPQWEAYFEKNSYGFRKGRGAWDALEALWISLNKKPKFALDADIKQCFDSIDHQYLLNKMNCCVKIRKQVQSWLKAAIVLPGSEVIRSVKGTPQGGVISPLLANIALHGLETECMKAISEGIVRDEMGVAVSPKDRKFNDLLVRYADDFVFLSPRKAEVEKVMGVVTDWLRPVGLELNPKKTRMVHTLERCDGNPAGFNFLGFHIQHHSVGKYRQGKIAKSKLVITPSSVAIAKHIEDIRSVLRNTREAGRIVKELAPLIRGWSNYYRGQMSKGTFIRMRTIVWRMLQSWASHKHPTQSKGYIERRYWRKVNGRLRFGFLSPAGKWIWLYEHIDRSIVRHVKVKGDSSPYDGNWKYWGGRHRSASERLTIERLLIRQKHRCAWCGLIFATTDVIEIDHIIAKKSGGMDWSSNLQVLHGHCHDSKTALQG